LSVLPTLVYGAPPSVRIDDGRMVYLRGAVPVRDEPAEKRLVQQLRDDLNLAPGRRASFEGADAAQFAQKLRRWRGALAGDTARLVGPDLKLEPRLRLSGDPVHFDLDFTVVGGSEKDRTVDAEA